MAIARPIPREAPVTMATRPSSGREEEVGTGSSMPDSATTTTTHKEEWREEDWIREKGLYLFIGNHEWE